MIVCLMADIRTHHFVITSAWLFAAVIMAVAVARAEEPVPPAKSLLSTKLPESDFSLALEADRGKGATETNPAPSALTPQRQPVMPFVGFSLSRPLDYPK
jgi:hypothetical protein